MQDVRGKRQKARCNQIALGRLYRRYLTWVNLYLELERYDACPRARLFLLLFIKEKKKKRMQVTERRVVGK